MKLSKLGIPLMVIALGMPALSACQGSVEPTRDDAGAVTEQVDNADVFSMKVGDCTNDEAEGPDESSTVIMVPCSEEHDNEAYASFMLDDGDYPGDDAVTEESSNQCETRFSDFIGIAYEDSIYDFFAVTPTEGSWGAGDREVICMAYAVDLSKITGTLEGIAE